MLRVAVNLPKRTYRDILKHLFPKRVKHENVSFIFASVSKADLSLDFNFIEWYPVMPDEYEFRSLGYVELKDEMRPKIIKKAFDLDAAIIEAHSHPYNVPARFSSSDLAGFEEFVPHVWWRLRGKPYAALVFSSSDFDGLAWVNNPRDPQPLTELVVNGRRLQPNGLTLSRISDEYEPRSL